MIGTEIVCSSCRRHWPLPEMAAVYSQMDLSTRPCPHCEAYTLSYQQPAVRRPASRLQPIWRQAPHGPRRPLLQKPV
jgi:hypothetical protein